MPAVSDGKMCFDMKLSRFVLVGMIVQLSGIPPLQAQQSPDSLLYKEAISNLYRIYLNEIGDNAQIYHGDEYIRNGQKALGFPYFQSDSMLTGSISYQGILYTDLSLFYNLVSDEPVIRNYAQNTFITLSPQKVDSFTIGGHFFLKLTLKSYTGLPVDGFYEQLYSGEPGFYVRREKKLVVGTGSEETKYIQYNSFFVRMKNNFYSVDGKNALLDLLRDQKDPLKKYIRASKLNFKKNLESSLLKATIYYSRLKT